MTRRLHDYVLRGGTLPSKSDDQSEAGGGSAVPGRHGTDTKAAMIYGWAEGAYGNLQHLDEFETLLLVAGGSGVSFSLPIMRDIVRRARKAQVSGERASNDGVATKRLVFVWIIKLHGKSPGCR